MKGYNLWSYKPYKPILGDVGDIYICRIVPSEYAIHFEWLENEEGDFDIYYRKRSDKDFIYAGKTQNNEYDILNLLTDTDYEFYVQAGDKKSRIRLARCGKSVGTVVNYLHPDDEAYAFSGSYLCSPSLVHHPDGYMLASMDVYGHETPQNLTLIFRSDDGGKTWYHLTELMPCFWGKLFLHNGEIYMLSCSTEFGDLLIGKSTDGGKTFSAPVTLLRGSNGKKDKHGILNRGIHKNPQNVMYYNDRIYHTLEWSSELHDAMVMSCNIDDDLLIPENWSFSEPKRLGFEAPELENYHNKCYAVEGTLVVDKKGKLLEIMRFNNFDGYALVYEVDTENHEAPLKYSRLMKFPGNLVKFMIKYDEISKKYYSIICRIHDEVVIDTRNLLSLVCSDDLINWELVCDLHDYRQYDHKKVGFQYVDFYIENEDIIYLCRTALNGANSHHDTNYSTFHRIKNFRDI